MIKNVLRASIILIVLLLVSQGVFAWCSGVDCNTDWEYKQELELNTEGILTSDVTNEHAILVHVDSSNTDFWDNIGLSDANDVRFTNSDDSIDLNYHFEDVNTDTNDLYAWVRVPEFDADAKTIINMYYGNSNAVDNQNEEGTYSNIYQAVYTMDNFTDRTSNSEELTNDDTTSYTNGQIGTARGFNGVDQHLNQNGNDFFSMSTNDPWSITSWVWADSTGVFKK